MGITNDILMDLGSTPQDETHTCHYQHQEHVTRQIIDPREEFATIILLNEYSTKFILISCDAHRLSQT